MKQLKVAMAIGFVAFAAAALAPDLQADEWNRKTTITFSAPVEIPGVHLAGWGTLPAGTYVFKVMDSLSDRHIVQISNKEETTIYATILAIPNYRLKATDKTVMTFRERAAGEPEALRAWFYPGRNWGEEFVYPKAKAQEIAKATNTAVLFTPAEIPQEVAEPIKADAPVVVELKRVPIMAIKPSGEEVQLAEVVTAPPAEVQAAATPAPSPAETTVAATPAPSPAETTETPAMQNAPPSTLPATASPMPLVAMFGLLAVGVALALRSLERRVN